MSGKVRAGALDSPVKIKEVAKSLVRGLDEQLRSYTGLITHFQTTEVWMMKLKAPEPYADEFTLGFDFTLGCVTVTHDSTGGILPVCPHPGCDENPVNGNGCQHWLQLEREWERARSVLLNPLPPSLRLFQLCCVTQEGIRAVLDELVVERCESASRYFGECHAELCRSVGETPWFSDKFHVWVRLMRHNSDSLVVEDLDLTASVIICGTPGCDRIGSLVAGLSRYCVECWQGIRRLVRLQAKAKREIMEFIAKRELSPVFLEQFREERANENSRLRLGRSELWLEILKILWRCGSDGYFVKTPNWECTVLWYTNYQLKFTNHASATNSGVFCCPQPGCLNISEKRTLELSPKSWKKATSCKQCVALEKLELVRERLTQATALIQYGSSSNLRFASWSVFRAKSLATPESKSRRKPRYSRTNVYVHRYQLGTGKRK